jgi:hypothetical protein
MNREDYKDLLLGTAIGTAGLASLGLGGHALLKSNLGKRLLRKDGLLRNIYAGHIAKKLEAAGKINPKMSKEVYQPILVEGVERAISKPANYSGVAKAVIPEGASLGAFSGLIHALNKKNKRLEKKGSALKAYGLFLLSK